MSEAPDQVAEAGVTPATETVAAEAPAADENFDTEAYDRAPEPPQDGEEAPTGQSDTDPTEAKPGAADDDTVEIERDGQKYRIPKALEAAVMKDADYTQKTQDLAEKRRTWEAERAQQAEALIKLRVEHAAVEAREADLTKISEDLGKYQQLSQADWKALKEQDPDAYRQHSENYDDLRRQRTIAEDALTAAKGALTEREASFAEERTAADKAKLNEAWGQTNAVLGAKIDNWGPDKFKEIGAWANKEFGITSEQLTRTTDPTSWIMANRLMKAEAEIKTLRAAVTQKTAADTTAKVAEVTPAAKPAGAAAPRGVRDTLSTSEWMAKRQQQLARKAKG